LVVVGDGDGKIGYGYGHGNQKTQAVKVAVKDAERRMLVLPTKNGTIQRIAIGRSGLTSVTLSPADVRTGIVGPEEVKSIADAAGLKYVVAVCEGPSSSRHIVVAAFNALRELESSDKSVRRNVSALEKSILHLQYAISKTLKRNIERAKFGPTGARGSLRRLLFQDDRVVDQELSDTQPPRNVMRPIVWIESLPIGEKLIPNEAYLLHLKMSDLKSPTLATGGQIRKDQIPEAGLHSDWVIISNSVKLFSRTDRVEVKQGDPERRQPWIACFALWIPKRNESDICSLGVVPLTPDDQILEVFVYTSVNMLGEFRRSELIRQFEIVLGP
jgi:small subunit ribosomal protein S5